MLACCNAARLWKETFIGVDVLEKNVICITFGQPLMTIPYVQEAVQNHANFESTIHSIFDQEDIFPRLLRDKYGQSLPQISNRPPPKAIAATNGSSPLLSSKLAPEVSRLGDVRCMCASMCGMQSQVENEH